MISSTAAWLEQLYNSEKIEHKWLQTHIEGMVTGSDDLNGRNTVCLKIFRMK